MPITNATVFAFAIGIYICIKPLNNLKTNT